MPTINSKWIRGVNIKTKPIEFLEDNTGISPCDPGLDNSFSNVTHQKHKQQKKKYIDLKLKF